jgi:hypothetical protein
MGGTVVIIVILAVIPVLVLMSMAPLAAIIGWITQSDRDDAYAGTEYLTLAYGPDAEKPADEPTET